jgi:hypothetical protein
MNMWETFVRATARYFRFLETEFGFARKATKQPNVIYESEKLQVQIYYDVDGRHELDLAIRRLADNSRKPLSLGMGLLMQLSDGLETAGYPSPYPSTEETLEHMMLQPALLQVLAKSLWGYWGYLSGNPIIWTRATQPFDV